MKNPNGIVDGNSQNNPSAKIPQTRSTFNLGYHFFDTHRFGEYHPHFVDDSVKNDKLPLRSSHNVMSYTLKSPLMQSITMHKDYFSVPMEAILPLNWEKFFDNPVRGEDVSTDVGPTVENFWNKVGIFSTTMFTQLRDQWSKENTEVPPVTKILELIRCFVILEYFYSNGSLLASLGNHGSKYLTLMKNGKSVTFDSMFDEVFVQLSSELGTGQMVINVDGVTYGVQVDTLIESRLARRSSITLRHALALFRDNPTGNVVELNDVEGTIITNIKSILDSYTFTTVNANVPCNLSRLWAYQLVCSHYYTNDHIDYVYSADLYRQLIDSYCKNGINSSQYVSKSFFTRNGLSYKYDALSAHYFDELAMSFRTISSYFVSMLTTTTNAQFLSVLGYLSALFAYRRSLRYQDYFTGSRTQPLAVGNTGVAVSGGSVDVIDITQGIQRQRFLNAVNRVRHSFEGYLQGVFGGELPAPDYHNPFYLARTSDTVFGSQTENTGAAQMQDQIAITTNLHSNGSRYMFEINSDRPCVVIGITSYDLPRVYSNTTERQWLHVNRFDMFNPFMQFVGDQPIYTSEIGVGSQLSLTNFAYTLRHMEYKQRYNQASGGFVDNLPGFTFIANDRRGSQNYINDDWIRSVPSEFDSFYVKLTGYSNGSYFHFIVDNYNDCTGQRPMAYSPSIL